MHDLSDFVLDLSDFVLDLSDVTAMMEIRDTPGGGAGQKMSQPLHASNLCTNKGTQHNKNNLKEKQNTQAEVQSSCQVKIQLIEEPKSSRSEEEEAELDYCLCPSVAA